MRAIPEARVLHLHQAQVGLVDECRWRQRMIRTLTAELMRRHAPQLFVHEGHDAVERRAVACCPIV